MQYVPLGGLSVDGVEDLVDVDGVFVAEAGGGWGSRGVQWVVLSLISSTISWLTGCLAETEAKTVPTRASLNIEMEGSVI